MNQVNTQKMHEAIRELRNVYYDAIASRIQHSAKSYAEIGAELGCSEQLVYQVARMKGLCRTAQKSDVEQADPGEISLRGGENGEL